MKFCEHFLRLSIRVGFILLGVAPFFGGVDADPYVLQEDVNGSLSDLPSALQNLLETPQGYARDKKGFTIPLDDVKKLYERVGFKPLWFTKDALTQCVESLLEALGHVDQEGLDQKDYDWALDIISQWSGSGAGGLEDQLRADILLSQALLQYISDLRGERLTPKKIDKELFMDKPAVEEGSLFLEAYHSPQGAGCKWLQALPPQSEDYKRLREELHHLLEVKENGLQGDPDSAKEKSAPGAKPRHHTTLAKEKSRSIENKIQQVIITMERLRWMPDNWGEKYLLVNIPAFRVTAVEGGKKAFSMPIIVGRDYRETPVLISKIINIIVNPSWNVPRMIAVKDELKLFQKHGPGYLTKKGFHVYKDGREVSPYSVNWNALNARNFDLHLRQDPGDMNALGRLRFTIPNPFSVYLHGTPKQKLFDEKKRTFSSGCIRLENPEKMALFVLEGNSGDWSLEKIKAAISTKRTETITLDHSVPVYLQYLTVVFNDEGVPEFLEDVYGQDKQIGEALKTRRAQGP